MIKIAFITSYGMDKGGTEKFLQTTAALLPKSKFLVDYYYIDNDDKRVSRERRNYLIAHDVNLITYQVDEIISKYRCIFQKNSTFFNVYEKKYDLIITGSCGLPEDPLINITDTPILQSIHYVSGVDDQYNISRVLHISEFSRDIWKKKGGDDSRSVMISHPIEIQDYRKKDIRKQFLISEDMIVFGLHQRENDPIFSDIPLAAYSKIEDPNTVFLLCGGSQRYCEQAKRLGLKKFYHIPSTDSIDTIYSFLEGIDIYAHGRYDGELNSTALAEAMYFGLPIISHPSDKYNGHLEVIHDNGFICKDVEEYATAMKMLIDHPEKRAMMAAASKKMYQKRYDKDEQINRIIAICIDAIKDPYQGRKDNLRSKLFRRMIIKIKRVIATADWFYRRGI